MRKLLTHRHRRRHAAVGIGGPSSCAHQERGCAVAGNLARASGSAWVTMAYNLGR